MRLSSWDLGNRVTVVQVTTHAAGLQPRLVTNLERIFCSRRSNKYQSKIKIKIKTKTTTTLKTKNEGLCSWKWVCGIASGSADQAIRASSCWI
mmetsp:Transcript_30140/g.47983  ORF Transcript_30140/g.47983 Transcript_30140/m.47983 type:complete len:93 (-) Transcript_30140:710-988(-)